MRLTNSTAGNTRVDLTYCTNVHPGESWQELRIALGNYLPEVKALVSPDAAFGVGLRLSERAARDLEAPDTYAEFCDFLLRNDLYVFTINGFPYGAFHQKSVKDNVYLPDWRDVRRLEYSNLLARLLVKLLPDDDTLEGSISTVPGGYKPHLTHDPNHCATITEHLLLHAAVLHNLHSETGRSITLALEPEPCCLLETIDETVTFFKDWIFSHDAIRRVASLCRLNTNEAEVVIRRHLGICLDTCHAAVEFENASDAVQHLRDTGIRIAKLQLSSGLRVPVTNAHSLEKLVPFVENVYLHQVVEQSSAGLRRMTDLSDALESHTISAMDDSGDREWRIHFHVPISAERLGEFESTRPFLEEILAIHRQSSIAPHLEVETYTWDVLPEAYRNESLTSAITSELKWVLQQIV